MRRVFVLSFVLAAGIAAGALPASAKPARCFTTDDGYYPCDFKGLDRQGSFEISARGYPTYTLWIDSPGFAASFVSLSGRSVALPGLYVRQRDDGACWSNPQTSTRICAW
ncbi:MAG: hypothetical protein M9945_15010 [Aquamicrobium sp.]|uniref:hypothetical protein n=1 Tax=Aquamicrobium sp. TaxID=1872579 RepID=UPI00349ED39C|nr:hypothetical protein [Aquamicrobium sp.]